MTPEILYKYRPIDEHTISLLKDNEIYLSNPIKDFNDPFDCKTIPEILNQREFVETMARAIVRAYPEVSLSELEADIRQGLNEARLDRFSSIFQEFVARTTGVYCLSEEHDNPLMFSHYASGHKGICLGFSTEELRRNVLNSDDILRKIIYRNSMRKVRFNKSDPFKLFVTTFTTKSKPWKYEREWRILTFGRSGPIKLSAVALREVIFGCETPSEDQKRILELIRSQSRAIKVQKAKRTIGELALRVVPLAQH